MKQNIDLKGFKSKLNKLIRTSKKHAIFGAIIFVLLVYILVVWKISQLATAEPTPEAEAAAMVSSNIPKVDKKAIEQIQALEQSNTQVQSLFNTARNNPFSE